MTSGCLVRTLSAIIGKHKRRPRVRSLITLTDVFVALTKRAGEPLRGTAACVHGDRESNIEDSNSSGAAFDNEDRFTYCNIP